MKTIMYLVFENNAIIVNNGLLKTKKWIGELTRLLRNWNFHIEFHAKLFIVNDYICVEKWNNKVRFEIN